FAVSQRRRPGRLLRQRAHDEPLDRRRLAPVAVEGFEHQLYAWLDRDDLVGAGADGGRLEAVLAHLLHVLLRDYPRRSRSGRGIERHEVRPRLLEDEADLPGRERLHLFDLVLEQRGGGALVPLEGEL